jgi:DNA-binding transcriptional MerR regulator/quercetin dioxygenase-like cupin family protein
MQAQPDGASGISHLGPSYSVGEAARMVGISPSTVRLYEKHGLLELRRTAGGHRFLTEHDLGTLKRIRLLRRTRGIDLEEIREDLQQWVSSPAGETAESSEGACSLGSRIRVLRERQRMTLREVAEKTGLSTSFLSSFERDLTGISVANLQRIISVCGSSLIDVFSQPRIESRRLIRPAERPRLALGGGDIQIEDLAVVPRQIEIQQWTIQPGAGSEGSYYHPGEEAVYILSGSLEVQLGGTDSYMLAPGDCLYFSSSEHHRWRNTGSQPAVALWVNTPPSF